MNETVIIYELRLEREISWMSQYKGADIILKSRSKIKRYTPINIVKESFLKSIAAIELWGKDFEKHLDLEGMKNINDYIKTHKIPEIIVKAYKNK